MSSETKFCSNCKKDIATANFTMHEMHCRRHLMLCEHCEEPIPRTEMEQHFTDVHAKIACTQCNLELEKDQLDAHLENDCPKRQVSCEFCELELPHSELAAHVDFCGTRTEACPRCGNFIMHKDLLRHNSSNCTFPEVKPPAASNTNESRDAQGREGGQLRNFGRFGEVYNRLDDSFDPFEFEEIRRALEGGADERGMPSETATVTDATGAAAAAAATEVQRKKGRGAGAWRKPALPSQRNDTRGAGTHKVTTNRKSEVNRQREQASSPTIPPDVDYDTMLAMQLAAEDDNTLPNSEHDLDPDAHLNQLISNFEKRSREHMQRSTSMETDRISPPASPPSNYNEFAAADDDMIPCEFCGETFPAFALVHHQSVCDPLASGIWGQVDESRPAVGRNNEMFAQQSNPPVSRPPVIPVINNLGSPLAVQEVDDDVIHHLTDNGDHFLNGLENIMLPCEFCNELLPADILVQHQAVCDSNRLTTPMGRAPAASQSSSGAAPTQGSSQVNQFFPTAPAPRSRRRQPDPTEELLFAINGMGQENRTEGSARPKKKPNASRGGNQAGRSTRPGGTGSRAGASRSPQVRGRIDSLNDEEPEAAAYRGSRQGRVDSAARTRHTLNSLLSDEDMEDSGTAPTFTVNASGVSRPSQGSRRKTPSTTAGVSTRTVMRSMQQQDARPGRQRAASRNDEEDGGADPGGRTASQRQRGDHLFNSPGNVRNPGASNRARRTNRQMPEWS